MVEVGIALTWIAMSAASVKGLSALARAASTSDSDAELMALAGESVQVNDGLLYLGAHAQPSSIAVIRSGSTIPCPFIHAFADAIRAQPSAPPLHSPSRRDIAAS